MATWSVYTAYMYKDSRLAILNAFGIIWVCRTLTHRLLVVTVRAARIAWEGNLPSITRITPADSTVDICRAYLWLQWQGWKESTSQSVPKKYCDTPRLTSRANIISQQGQHLSQQRYSCLGVATPCQFQETGVLCDWHVAHLVIQKKMGKPVKQGIAYPSQWKTDEHGTTVAIQVTKSKNEKEIPSVPQCRNGFWTWATYRRPAREEGSSKLIYVSINSK